MRRPTRRDLADYASVAALGLSMLWLGAAVVRALVVMSGGAP